MHSHTTNDVTQSPWPDINSAISTATGRPFSATNVEPTSGGWINEAYSLSDVDRRYFVKLNTATALAMFAAEAQGLQLMASCHEVRVPTVVTLGDSGKNSYIVLEYIDMKRPAQATMAKLGTRLAALHRHTSSRFGLDFDNTVGSTPQQNNWLDCWPDFFREQRLRPIFTLASSRYPYLEAGLSLLAEKLPDLFKGYEPTPSLVHGDLWSGNAGEDEHGEPVLFDPALYWGDREVDLAMTELFGGFSSSFYQAYQASWPLDEGYGQRKWLYQLYYYLNHIYLFGESDRAVTEQLIGRVLST